MWSVWLVFCDCGFHSVCLLMDKDKSPMETSWWERLWEKLVLVLMGGARLSKSLIQFSVDGWGCVPFLLFDLRPNYGGGNEDNGDLLQKVPCTHCCMQCFQPCSRPPPTHTSARDFWTFTGKSGSVSCGVTGAHNVLFVLSKSLFPQSSVNSGGPMVGLMETSSKRAYAISRSAAPRAPAPEAVHCWPVPPQETLTHSKAALVPSRGAPGSWWIQGFVWALQASLVGMGFDSKCNFAPPIILLGLFLCPWTWDIFFWWDLTFSCRWLLSS